MAEAYHDGMRSCRTASTRGAWPTGWTRGSSRSAFTDEDRAFIEQPHDVLPRHRRCDGQPDCSYKGGEPGFVRVTADDELAFPSYDGNGMFRSLGNMLVNAAVALLFIDFERPNRLRVNGRAQRGRRRPAAGGSMPGAQLIVRVKAERIFPNCPRYIHRMAMAEPSPYVPREGYTPPIPKWKRFEMFCDVLPRGDPAREPEPPAKG